MSLALVSVIPFVFFFDSKPKETRTFSTELRVIGATFEFERNDSSIFLDEVSVRNLQGPNRNSESGFVDGRVPTRQSEDLNRELLNSSAMDAKTPPKEEFPLRKTSGKKEKFFAEISDLDPLDPVFVYLSEDKLLTLQLDFFLNVTLNSAHQLNQLLKPSVELSNIRKMRESRYGTNLYDLTVILPNRENRKLKPDQYQSLVSLFRMNRIDFDLTSMNPKRSERPLVSFKFHRYFALLFSFPPNLPEGQNESC
ncbi:hypothetical protein [Leptospira weilii]|uniref:hypothetical protein n=1 Tax=Leptospira weilii TaxID=28184 RepID=UPI001EF2AF52|nr:hypothetical protein [Leptospira weilii]ULH29588.1 hypothetical protein FH586_06840 [Leptospira weilii]